jgi:hypothetical protein
LFLCETVSIFTLFVILNKVFNDELIINNHHYLLKNTYPLSALAIISYLYRCDIDYIFVTFFLNFFTLETLNSNDFWSLTILFFANTYNTHFFICTFLILISYLVVIATSFTYNVCTDITTLKSAITSSIFTLFSKNNIVVFKAFVFINFFKK